MEGDESLDQFICAKCGAPANQRCTGTERIIAAEKIKAKLRYIHLQLVIIKFLF